MRPFFIWLKAGKGPMERKSLCAQTLMVGLLLLSGCDVTPSARNDLNRIVSSDPSKSRPPQTARHVTPVPAKAAPATAPTDAPAAQTASAAATAKPGDPGEAAATSPVSLIGKNEDELRSLFGPPTSIEERAPGKTWKYRDGQCSLDIQLYPDVQTRKFGTLAYEVKSDDNTDEANRACLAHLKSRSESPG
jgi:hypothetical protein